MKQHPVAFAVAYALIGAQALAAAAAFVVIMFTPVSPVAHKSDVRAALGVTDEKKLLAQAEKAIAQEGATEGLTVTSQKLVRVKRPDANTLVFVIKAVTAEFGPVTIDVTFHKGIYSISGMKAE